MRQNSESLSLRPHTILYAGLQLIPYATSSDAQSVNANPQFVSQLAAICYLRCSLAIIVTNDQVTPLRL